jgi:two-component system LytT family response regulator
VTLRAFIVDDEPLARQRIRLLARDEPGLEIIGGCESGPDALAAIERDAPALLFLDVQMPEMDGFELLHNLPRGRCPAVIFTTAFDRHAVRAFEAHALDYLLKPFSPERFRAAAARARAHLANHQAAEESRRSLQELLAQIARPAAAATRFLNRFTIRHDDKVFVVPAAEVDSIESAGNYVAVNAGEASHILRETPNALEAQLDPEKFLRVSRSVIVNLDRVKELQPMFKGENVLILQSGRRIVMTRVLREVEQALKFG